MFGRRRRLEQPDGQLVIGRGQIVDLDAVLIALTKLAGPCPQYEIRHRLAGLIRVPNAVLLAVVVGVDQGLHVAEEVALFKSRREADPEEQLVLDDRSADLEANVGVIVRLVDAHQGRVGLQDQLGVGGHPVRRPIHERRAVVVVRTRFRHDVDHAAHRATEFGVVAAGVDLELLDEIQGQVRTTRRVRASCS